MGQNAGFVALGVVILVMAMIGVAIGCAVKKQQRQAALHAPLIDSGNRLNTALRDAQASTLDCDVCGFENASRNAHCRLCGNKLAPHDESCSDAVWRRIFRAVCFGSSGKRSGHGVPRPENNIWNSRQRRARKRKEWTRTLHTSSDGRHHFVWRRLRAGSTTLHDEGVQIDCRDESYENRIANPLTDVIVVPAYTSAIVEDGRGIASQSPKPQIANTSVRLHPAKHGQRDNRNFVNTGSSLDARVFANLSASTFPIKYAHFVTASASLLGEHLEKPRVTFKISRHRAYEQSMTILSELPTESLRSRLSIEFEGESGIDAGGLLRDWLTVMSEGLVGAETCTGSSDAEGNTDANEKGGAGGDGGPRSVRHTNNVFEAASAEDVTYHLRSGLSRADGSESDTMQQPSTVMLAFAAGRFVGRTLLEGYPLGFHLSLPLLKMMVGIPMSFSDLEFFDVESFHSLSWLLEHDGVDALGLDFTVTEMYEMASSSEETKQVVKTRELVAGGADIDVTDANKREFVSLKFRDLVFGRVERELGSFLRGVYEVVPADLLALFDPEEMDYLVSGSDEIDVGDWRRNTKYNEDLQGHMAMRWFWELVEEMPTEYRRRLLRFSTGSSRVPLGGFAALTSHDGKLCPFTLIGVSYVYSNGYIRSHACFNRLDLPLYVDRDDLKRVLYTLLGAESTAGFTME